MPKNTSTDLNNLLFETIERLMDEDDPMDIKRAEAVAKTAQVIVNNAKNELVFMKQNRIIGAKPNYFSTTEKQVIPNQLSTTTDKCVQHAIQFGHTQKDAEECENYSVGCPNCPFEEGKSNV